MISDNTLLRLDIRSNLTRENKYFELYNKICHDSVESFNQLINSLSKENDSIDWWLCNPLSRNVYNSILFRDYCKIELVKDLSTKIRIQEIITDSEPLAKILKELPELKKTNISFKGFTQLNSIKNLIIIILLSFRECLFRIYQFLIFNIFFYKKAVYPNHPIKLIDTFAMPGYYSKDRYYNDLLKNLSDEEKEKIFFLPTIIKTKITKLFPVFFELINANRQFLFKESFLKIADIIYASFYPVRIQFFRIKSFFLMLLIILP